MSNAYIDTSLLVAIETREPNFELYEEELTRFDWIYSSNLLEAEYRSVCMRLRRDPSDLRLSKVTWIIPEYPFNAGIENCTGCRLFARCGFMACCVGDLLRERTDDRNVILNFG